MLAILVFAFTSLFCRLAIFIQYLFKSKLIYHTGTVPVNWYGSILAIWEKGNSYETFNYIFK